MSRTPVFSKSLTLRVAHTALHNTPFVIATLDEPGIIGAAMLPMSEGI